jgi:superfamily II DNA/RNA helicase
MLVTTEMASRGLDLPRLSMCVNLAPPPSYTHYLHRAGRLGRIHTTKSHLRKGTVITLVSDDVRPSLPSTRCVSEAEVETTTRDCSECSHKASTLHMYPPQAPEVLIVTRLATSEPPPPHHRVFWDASSRRATIPLAVSDEKEGCVGGEQAEAAAVQQHAVDLRLDLSRGTLESGELQYPGKAAELAAREKLNGERIAARARGEAEASSDEEDALSADEEGDASGERDEAVKSVSEAGGEKKSKRKGKGGRKGGRNKGNVAAVA